MLIIIAVICAAIVIPLGYLTFHIPDYPAERWSPADMDSTAPVWDNAITQAELQRLDIAPYTAPETMVFHDSYLYASVSGNYIIRIREDGSGLEEIIHTSGSILGFDFDDTGNLYFCDATYDKDGGAICVAYADEDYRVEPLVRAVNGTPLTYPDSLCISSDGKIFFSDATDVKASDSDLMVATSVAAISHRTTGSLYMFDPGNGESCMIVTGFCFTNGVQLTADESAILVNDTYSSQTWRIDLRLRNAVLGDNGTSVLLGNIPGCVDNMQKGLEGHYWIGMPGPRIAILERLSQKLWFRNLVLNLPDAALLKMSGAVPYDLSAVCINEQGDVLQYICIAESVQTTGITETEERLYIHHLSMGETNILFIDKAQIGLS